MERPSLNVLIPFLQENIYKYGYRDVVINMQRKKNVRTKFIVEVIPEDGIIMRILFSFFKIYIS